MALVQSGTSVVVPLSIGSTLIVRPLAGGTSGVASVGPSNLTESPKTIGLSKSVIGPYPEARDVCLMCYSGTLAYYPQRPAIREGGLFELAAADAVAPTPDILADLAATYWCQGARYGSDGTQLVQLSGSGTSAIVTLDGGGYGLSMPGGSAPFPLTILAGLPTEPVVAGVVQQVVNIDAGSDADHAEILITFNCSNGDLESASEPLMSQRFANASDNAEVIKTTVTGAYGTGAFFAWEVPATLMHIALAGGSSYTTAAGNTVTGTEAVLLSWAAASNIGAVEVRMATATIDGGETYHSKRVLVVTGYQRA